MLNELVRSACGMLGGAWLRMAVELKRGGGEGKAKRSGQAATIIEGTVQYWGTKRLSSDKNARTRLGRFAHGNPKVRQLPFQLDHRVAIALGLREPRRREKGSVG